MQSKCSHCDCQFDVAEKPSAKFAAMIGAAAGMAASRRMGGAVVGSMIGYGLARAMGSTLCCPRCNASTTRPVEV